MLCNYFHNVIPFVIISKEFRWIMCNNCPTPMCKPWPGAKTLAQNYWHTLLLPFIPSAQCTGISAVKLVKPLWHQIDHIGADEGALSALLWSWLLHSQATNKHIGTHYMCRWSAKCTKNCDCWFSLDTNQTWQRRSRYISKRLGWLSLIRFMNGICDFWNAASLL